MRTHRFGQRIKLPSTRAIKHQIWQLTLEDYRRAQVLAGTPIEGIDAEGRRHQEPALKIVHAA